MAATVQFGDSLGKLVSVGGPRRYTLFYGHGSFRQPISIENP